MQEIIDRLTAMNENLELQILGYHRMADAQEVNTRTRIKDNEATIAALKAKIAKIEAAKLAAKGK